MPLAGNTSTVSWDGWQTKKHIGRRKVSRSIAGRTVGQMFNVWHFARDLKLPFNRFVTIRPRTIDTLSPAQRITLWEDHRNKIAQFARDNHFEHVCLWSRESTRNTGEAEHLHLLTHIPAALQDRFSEIGSNWFGGSDEILIAPATYRQERTPSGRLHSAVTYLAKNAPGSARFRNFTYRLGGPILGKRVGWSRNVGPAAQARRQARFEIRREFGGDRAVAVLADAVRSGQGP